MMGHFVRNRASCIDDLMPLEKPMDENTVCEAFVICKHLFLASQLKKAEEVGYILQNTEGKY